MKSIKVVGLALLIMSLVGLAGLATTKTWTCTVTIPGGFVFNHGTPMTFDASAAYAGTGESGEVTFDTNTVWADVLCNQDVSWTLNPIYPFHTTGGYTLETDWWRRHDYRTGEVYGPRGDWTFNLASNGSSAPDCSPFTLLHANTQGYYKFQTKLRVHRNGYSDHSGTYSTTITITLSMI